MALMLDLNVGDEIVAPAACVARIRVLAKNGRRTRVAVESDERVEVRRAHQVPKPARERPNER